MTSHRTIFLTLTLLAVLTAAAPSCAFANSLLSGYGGPGEGSQAIIGSALVGGAGGGGGSSGGSSGPSGSSSGDLAGAGPRNSAGTAAPKTGAGTAAPSGSRGRGSGSEKRGAAGRAADRGAGSRGRSGEASGGVARAYPVLSRDQASRSAFGGSAGPGVSGEDLGYVLFALAALAVTGVVTRWLVRASPVRPEGL
jgi:hypothetical protein